MLPWSLRRLLLLVGFGLTSPAHAAWHSFQIIEWQPRNKAQLLTLRELGVTAVAVVADRDGTGTKLADQTAAPQAADLRWYVENIATDFYAPYHRYTPGRAVNWRFLAAQQQYRADPANDAALLRDPPLLDSVWRARVADRLTAVVSRQQTFHPLYYSLGDETGIADLAAFWDFDLSPVSVAGFRTWLRQQYDSLAALNAEWGTAYTAWDAVQPETTQQVMRRSDDNFAAWNDFKAWMDTSFADAVRFGTDTIHRADPQALSAIEGVQLPGWGGYDYAKLAPTADVMEVYDSDVNLPLLRSLNPAVVPLVTSFAATPASLHDVWRSVLRGARGLILWDEAADIVGPDGAPGPGAAAYRKLFTALRGTVGQWLIAAQPRYDNVAILYSPASFRVSWLLEHRHDGAAWMNRSAASEWQDNNAWRVALRDYFAALSRIGLHPRFITEQQLVRGLPARSVLILPHTIALSEPAARTIAAFAARGGQVIADTPPGQFDGHGRRRNVAAVAANIVAPANLPQAVRLQPGFPVQAPDGDVEAYVFGSHGHQLLALQRREPHEPVAAITVRLQGQQARDLVTGRDYGRHRTLHLSLGPVTPIVLDLGRYRRPER